MRNFRFTFIALAAVVVVAAAFYITPEYARYALIYQFPNIDDYRIFDNRTVIAGNYRPWMLERGMEEKELPDFAEEELEKYKTVAFLVVKNKEIAFEKYWDSYSANSMSGCFSMTKSIVGLLTGIAIDEGYIKSADQPVGDFVPRFSSGELGNLTIRHLLTMSSGLNWSDSFRNPFGNTARAYYGDDLKSMVLDLDFREEPGKNFRYSNMDTQPLALVLENATGMSLSAWASQKLWKPMGAKRDAYWSLDEVHGTEKAYCGFNSNARDLARFGQLVLNDGRWEGRQLISSGYLRETFTPASHLTDRSGSNLSYYGFHWWISDYEGMVVYSMRGLKGQFVIVIPDKDIVIVRLGKKDGADRDNFLNPPDMLSWIKIGIDMAEAN